MHAATCMRLPSRPWCLPPQLCVRKHTCSSAAQCSVHAVYTRLAAASGGSVLVKAAAGEASDVVADLGVESQPEPAPTPAAVTADSADSTSASEPSLDKPKRVPWNKGRKHLPGTIERIKAGNAAALQRPEVQAKIKAVAEARRGVATGKRGPQAPKEKKVKVPFEDMTPEQQAAVEAAREKRAEATRRLWQDPAYRAKVAASLAERKSMPRDGAQAKQQRRGNARKQAAGQSVAGEEQVAGTSVSSIESSNSSSSSSSKRRRATSKAAAVQVEVLSEDGSPLPLAGSSRKARARKPKAAKDQGETSSSTGSSRSRSSRKAGSSTAAEDASTAWDVPTVGSGKPRRTPAPGSEGKSRRRAASSQASSEAAAARRKEAKALTALHGQLATSAQRLVQLQQLITQTGQMLANLSSAAAELVNDRLGTARLQQVAAAANQRLQDAQEQVHELEGLLQLHGATWDTSSGELLEVRHPQLPEQQQQQQQDSSSSSSVAADLATVGGAGAGVAPISGRTDTAHVMGEVVGSTDAPMHAAAGGHHATAAAAVDSGGRTPLLHAELVSAAVSVEARTQAERSGGGVWL